MSQAGASDPLKPNYELLKSNMGGQMLLHGGHAYYMHRNNQNSSMWTCIKRKKLKCGGSVKLSDENDLVSVKHQHISQCEPDHRKLEIRKALRELSEEVRTSSDPVRRLFELKMAELRKKGLGSVIPKFDSVNSMLYRARQRATKVHTDVKSRGEESPTENHADSQECQGQADLGQDSKAFPEVKLRHRSPDFVFCGSPDSEIDPEGENETMDAEPLSEPEPKPKVKKTKKKKRRRRRSDSSDGQQKDEEPSESPGGSSDSDRLFLLSFLPEMQRLPPHIKMWARTRIANVMQEAVSYHYDNQPLPLPDTDIKHANINT